MVAVLVISLAISFYFIYYLFNREILNPALMFCVSFLFSSVWALAYADVWELDLHLNTYLVIFGGVLIFAFFSYVIFSLQKGGIREQQSLKKIVFKFVEIENWKLIIVLLLEAICFLSLYRILSRSGLGSNIFASISSYRVSNLNYSSTGVSIPTWLSYGRSFSTAAGYWFSFVLANNLFSAKKKISLNNILMLLIIAFAIINSCMLGGRQQFINIILAFLASMLFFDMRRKSKNGGIGFGNLCAVILIAVIALFAFKNASGLVGKDLSNVSLSDYLAKYCGAEIKNLDIYLQKDNITGNSSIWGFQTFRSILSWIGMKLPARDIPYNYINGFSLGNVYTTFYDYIYDFGYFGMVLLVAFMAIFTQYIYVKMRNIEYSSSSLILGTVFAFQVPNVLLSFFSDEFYIYTFSSSFVKYIIFWVILYFCMCKIRVKSRQNGLIITVPNISKIHVK